MHQSVSKATEAVHIICKGGGDGMTGMAFAILYHFFYTEALLPYFAVLFCKISFFSPHHISSPCATTDMADRFPGRFYAQCA